MDSIRQLHPGRPKRKKKGGKSNTKSAGDASDRVEGPVRACLERTRTRASKAGSPLRLRASEIPCQIQHAEPRSSSVTSQKCELGERKKLPLASSRSCSDPNSRVYLQNWTKIVKRGCPLPRADSEFSMVTSSGALSRPGSQPIQSSRGVKWRARRHHAAPKSEHKPAPAEK